jgi:hypothetical protein
MERHRRPAAKTEQRRPDGASRDALVGGVLMEPPATPIRPAAHRVLLKHLEVSTNRGIVERYGIGYCATALTGQDDAKQYAAIGTPPSDQDNKATK